VLESLLSLHFKTSCRVHVLPLTVRYPVGHCSAYPSVVVVSLEYCRGLRNCCAMSADDER
jgi:hypothetical protein